MEIMVTLTGISHYIDWSALQPNQEVTLRKEPHNQYDTEAIAVYMNGITQIGNVANSVYSVAKGTYSAGRLYDKIGNEAKARIMVVMKEAAILTLHVDGWLR